MALVVLKYAYEGVVVKDGNGYKLLVSGISNCSDELINCLVNLFRREVERGGMGESVELIVLEHHLLMVAPPSKQLMGAGNLDNIGVVR